MCRFQAVCIGNRIIISGLEFANNQSKVYTYNAETSEWKFIDCSLFKSRIGFGFVKYHKQ